MRRRTLLATMAAMAASGGRARIWADDPADPPVRDEDAEVFEMIRELLKQAEIGPLRSSSTRNYLCAGDLSVDHRLRVGRFCESFLVDALAMFRHAGFAPRPLERRLTVVVLSHKGDYDRLARLVQAVGSSTGFYQPTLRAVCFCLVYKAEPQAEVDWEMTFRVAGHEAMHQICYHSGLVNPAGDTPACVNEGLAVLGEIGWKDRTGFLHLQRPGRVERLGRLARGGRIPLAEMLCEDAQLRRDPDPERVLDAYAHSWFFVQTLMSDPELRPKFRAYLAAIFARKDPSHRLEDARAHLGDLKALDARITRRLRGVIERPPSRFSSPRRGPVAR